MADSSEDALQLLALGITDDPAVAARALQLADGNLERACDIIMEGRLDLSTPAAEEATTPPPDRNAPPEADTSPAPAAAEGERRFPAHWGDAPLAQTRDLRPLPGGYGSGSGTLAAWIEGKLAEDERAAAPTEAPTDADAVERKAGRDGVTLYCGQSMESGAAVQQMGGERLCGPEDGPQCGCCRAFPNGLMRGQPLEFPEHWGSPPLAQTLDLVMLPGGGMGSGTLLRWIQQKITHDTNPQAEGSGGAAAAASEPEPSTSSASGSEIAKLREQIAAAEAKVKAKATAAEEGDLIVAVGSNNPVKLEATRRAFQSVFSNRTVAVVGVGAASGVPDQPMGDEETKRGAQNRAEAALAAVPVSAHALPTATGLPAMLTEVLVVATAGCELWRGFGRRAVGLGRGARCGKWWPFRDGSVRVDGCDLPHGVIDTIDTERCRAGASAAEQLGVCQDGIV